MQILSNVSKLYDGTSSNPEALHSDVDIHVRSGRILEVRPHDPEARTTSDRTVIDCSGYTVTPGLVDCHGHITILGITSEELERMDRAEGWLLVEKILHASLVLGGVTTMRDIGGATHAMKRLVDEGIMIGPRLKVAICMLSTTGGHADFRGPDRCHAEVSKLWKPGPGRPESVVDGPWECRKRVREIAACGADVIKLCTSPGVASPGDHLEHRDFTAEEIGAICDEAGARGLKVAAHAHSQSGIDLAIENGVSDIQHISFMNERLVERAYERGCTVTPTSWVMYELPKAAGLSEFVMEKVKKVTEHHATAVQYARSGGLKILGGTDPVLPGMHGKNYLELDGLMRDGLEPLEAWYSMTGLAAGEIGQGDAGSVAEGQRADLLFCRKDVIADPSSFDDDTIVEVMKDGEGYCAGIPGMAQRSYGDTVRTVLDR